MSVLIEKATGVYEPTAVYDAPANAPVKDKTALGYVESAEGRLFKVLVEDKRVYKPYAVAVALWLDGVQ